MNEELDNYLNVKARHISQISSRRRHKGDMGVYTQMVIPAVDEWSLVNLNVVYVNG